MAGAVLVGGLAVSGVAGAQSDDSYVGASTTVLNTEVPQAPATVENQQVSPAETQASDGLAFTGGDAAAVALVGGGLLVAGVAVLAVRRRQAITA
jgi:LPXTG-motif cell wall-anchored protein